MHQLVVKFSKFSSPQTERGHWPPNQNPADATLLLCSAKLFDCRGSQTDRFNAVIVAYIIEEKGRERKSERKKEGKTEAMGERTGQEREVRGGRARKIKKGTGSPYSITERTVPELSFTHKMAAKTSWHIMDRNHIIITLKGTKVAHTRLQSVGFPSRSRFFAVSLQVKWVINPAVGCHYFSPALQLPP